MCFLFCNNCVFDYFLLTMEIEATEKQNKQKVQILHFYSSESNYKGLQIYYSINCVQTSSNAFFILFIDRETFILIFISIVSIVIAW